MERKQLEKTFCWKINSELKIFKYEILQKEKEEIMAEAYLIVSMISIYEQLLELCQKMKEEELTKCIQISGLLQFLFDEWIKKPDTQYEEMEHILCSVIHGLSEKAA